MILAPDSCRKCQYDKTKQTIDPFVYAAYIFKNLKIMYKLAFIKGQKVESIVGKSRSFRIHTRRTQHLEAGISASSR